MAKLIGTAGHVDHGKTTLIRALTGIDTDRLPEEKRRQMTIDVGFAHIELPGIGQVSIVDVPGHVQFLHNMLVGALGIDVALLCVAADASVMPQTREHLQILELLPVDRLVVALTRADLADADMREITRTEVEELLAATRFGSAPILPVSATSGEGLEELKAALAEALRGEDVVGDAPWYLPVDRVFSAKGHGCVVTGTLVRGRAKVGDEAFLEPNHLAVRIRGIEIHSEPHETTEKGRRTAMNLSGVKAEDVRRGMVLGAAGAVFVTEVIDARVRWVAEPRHGSRVRVSIGSDEVMARAFLNDHDRDVVQLRLERPVACALEQPLILRAYSPPGLLAGGRVVVPEARVRRKKDQVEDVQTRDLPQAILEIVGANPDGVHTTEICRRLGRSAQQLGDVFERLRLQGKLRGFAGVWTSPEGYRVAAERFRNALREIHAKHPTQAMIVRERAIADAELRWAGKPLDRLMAAMAEDGLIEVTGTTVRDAEHLVQLIPRQREFLDRVVTVLERETINVPKPVDIMRELGVPLPAVEETLKLGVQAGELVPIGEGLHYTHRQLEKIREQIREAAGGKPFTPSEMRERLGTSRKFIVPLLEYLDAKGFTMRQGDNRVVR